MVCNTVSCQRLPCIRKGWQKFFLEHVLKVGELLVFEYIGGSDFIVQIYGKSACERTNFNNKMPCRSKKRGRDQGTASKDEAYEIACVNSSNKSISVSGDGFQNRKTKHTVENAGLGVSELLPVPVDNEDPICMINKSDWYHEEHRNSLDLSFEMENRTSDAKKCEGAVITMLDPHTETEQHDVNLENASGPKLYLSCNRVLESTNPAHVEQTKTNAEDARVVVIETDLITSKSGELPSDKFVKALDAKTALSRTEIADEIRKNVDDTQMAPHSCQEGGQSGDAFLNKFYEKPSDDSKMKKSMLDNVCSFQDVIPVAFDKAQSINESPFIGSSKIAEREHAGKSIFGEFSVSSSTVKNPLGLHAIMKEVKMEYKANVFHQVPSGAKEPSMMWNQPQMIAPLVVKAEPDLPYETGQLDTTNPFSICPFSAEIESQLYLEMPVQIILPRVLRAQATRFHTTRGQMMRARMIVYI